MLQDRIAERYAKSVYDLATERKELPAVYADFQAIDQLITGSRELRTFLKQPTLSHHRKEAILKRILEGKATDMVSRFVSLLTVHGREDLLGLITKAFLTLYDRLHNRNKVDVTSAEALTPEQRKLLLAKLATVVPGEILLEEKTDPALIGGIIINTADRQYDGSLATALKNLKKQLQETAYTPKI